MTKILFFGTHPRQFNGYSKVVYEIMKCMSKMKDVQLTVYGFQNFYDNAQHRTDLPDNVIVYDAFANENPKTMGFGIPQIQSFVTLNDPDVCFVYNDMMVVTQVISELQKVPNRRFKIVAYIDQVYLNQKKMFIDFINKNVDVSVLFTKHWEDIIVKQGVKTPTFYLPHGFNPQHYYPIPKNLARQYFNVSSSDFIILNLNRNQPRKRWDICLKAFAEIVSRYPKEPIKMMIGTAVQGSWNLIEMFERELGKRNVTLEEGMKHIIVLDNPQKLSDEETNILYNIADIGINTCDGEGFGLCNFEQAGLGIPQIVSRLGGFIDFFDDDNSVLLDPRMSYYVDSTRDMVSGEALLCDYMDVVEGIETYYFDRNKIKEHGQNARNRILKNYDWTNISHKLRDILQSVVPLTTEEKNEKENEKKEINEMIAKKEDVDTDSLDKLLEEKRKKKTGDTETENKSKKLTEEEEKKKKELLEMQKKIEEMLKTLN